MRMGPVLFLLPSNSATAHPIAIDLPPALGSTPTRSGPWSSFWPNGGCWPNPFTVFREDLGDFGVASLEFGAIGRNDDHKYMRDLVNSGQNDDRGPEMSGRLQYQTDGRPRIEFPEWVEAEVGTCSDYSVADHAP